MSQKRGEQNLQRFHEWTERMTDDDFKSIVYGPTGKLNLVEVSKGCQVSKTALKTNQGLVSALRALESALRARNVLPPNTPLGQADENAPKAYDPKEKKNRQTSQRVKELEAQNRDLRAKVAEYEKHAETIEAIQQLNIFKTLEITSK